MNEWFALREMHRIDALRGAKIEEDEHYAKRPDKGQKESAKGLNLYINGKYKRAYSYLWMACRYYRYYLNAIQLADICYRNLDGKNHTKEEAAYWYFVAADNGDGDALSYLDSMHIDFSGEDRIDLLVAHWNQFHLP
jgi:hypothetical protein